MVNWKTGYTLLLAIAMLVLVACNSAATPASPREVISTPVPGSTGTPTPIIQTETPTPQTQFDLPGVLIQEEVEPTFSPWPYAFHPYGRVPGFTLMDNGRLIYLDEGKRFDQQRIMEGDVSAEDAQALMQRVLDLGFERLRSYVDECQELGGGNSVCVADASYTILRVRLPSGEPREVKIYADFGADPAALEAIRSFLGSYSHPDAQDYVPEKATLFLRPISEAVDVSVQEWPLDGSWLEPPPGREQSWATVIDGDELKALLSNLSRNTGYYWFRGSGRTYQAYLVPWLPGVDYADDVAGYGQ